jgi:hypothetical protein
VAVWLEACSEDGREQSESGLPEGTGDPLAYGEGLGPSTELPDRELGPCDGFLVRGSKED